MAPSHHTQVRKEVRRDDYDATAFPQPPAPVHTLRPYTTRISQPTNKQNSHKPTRQARRQPQNDNSHVVASHGHKLLSSPWSSGQRGLSRTNSRRICNGILAMVVVLGIILTVVFILKKVDQSRH